MARLARIAIPQVPHVANIRKMEAGLAPIAPEVGQVGARITFEIHHPNEIGLDGPVYDLGNMQIVMPKTHMGIHYGKK